MQRVKPCPTASLLQDAEATLTRGQVEGARLAARELLAKAVNGSASRFVIHSPRSLSPKKEEMYRALLRRRAQREPLQYLLGEADFLEWTFLVSPACLIPRPETETLVEAAVERVQSLEGSGSRGLEILDLGTGCGNIAVSLALRLAGARIVATDLSSRALAVAQANARRLGVSERIDFCQGRFFEPLCGQTFDLIISNPPYLSEREWAEAQPEVRREPKEALVAGPKGTECYEAIIPSARVYLKEGGSIAFEVGWKQADTVSSLLRESEYREIDVVKDFAGIDRVVMAKKDKSQKEKGKTTSQK